jgi:hypothetical protein
MKFINALFITAAFVLAASGQSPQKILKLAEKALGGTKALQQEGTVVRRGRVTLASDGSSGAYVMRTAEPDLYYEDREFNGVETETGSNGRSGWLRSSAEGLRTLTGEESVFMRAKAAYRNHLWLERKREKLKITPGGQTTINGKPAVSVVLTTVRGAMIRVYFDASTYLPVRDEITYGRLTETTDLSDNRSVGSVRTPFSMRVTSGSDTYNIELDTVDINSKTDQANFAPPVISGEPLPEIRQLLSDLQANEDRVEELLDSYSFTQKTIKREVGKDGVLRETGSETYQLSFYKGERIKRLIEKDGKPLNAKDQADEDREVAKRVDEIEKRIARKEKQPESDNRISIAEMLRASNLINPRRERFRGRDVIVFDFEPNPKFDYKNSKSMLKFFGKTTGVMWIDEHDKQVARLEAALSESFGVGGGVVAKLKKGATFSLEQERVNEEIWLPSLAEINLSVRVLLLKGIDLNQIVRSYNYRKFATEVKGATVGDPPKPE